MMNISKHLALTLSLVSLNPTLAFSMPSVDSTAIGPHQVASGEYRLPAATNPDVLPNQKTEIWAKVFYPADIQSMQNKLPLLILLHGNHSTCGHGNNPRIDDNSQYTTTGRCPKDYVPVPSHEGYNYFAQHLASWGYLVVSINVNRGINAADEVSDDIGLIKARGRMVLQHLNLLYQWSTNGNAPANIGVGQQGLIGKIDFSSVGLFGHSRGGQGVRAAYEIYQQRNSPWQNKIPGLSIKAIFEIGATDFFNESIRPMNAYGVAWNQLLPMCDGDVYDLQGRFPFERMMLNTQQRESAQKSLYEVWGANHNYFNTEWQRSDTFAENCKGETAIFDENLSGSDTQQKIALASVTAFFRSHVGYQPDDKLDLHFNPLAVLPPELTHLTEIGRDFSPTAHVAETTIFDDFDGASGINSYGFKNIIQNMTLTHTGTLPRKATLRWDSSGQHVMFESVWAAPQQGRDIHDYATLDFRVARAKHKSNVQTETDFEISLVDADGKISQPVAISDLIVLDGPVGYSAREDSLNSNIFKTVRIPLSSFSGVNLSNIHSVRFVFNRTSTGAIHIANLRVQKNFGEGYSEQAPALHQPAHQLSARVASTASITIPEVPVELNTIRDIRVQKSANRTSRNSSPDIEIKLASSVPFLVKDALPTLIIGDKHITRSRYSDSEHSKEITFLVSNSEYEQLAKDQAVTVVYGKRWKFATLNTFLRAHARKV